MCCQFTSHIENFVQNLSGVLFGNKRQVRVFSTQQHIVDRQKETRTLLYFINQLTNSSTLRPLRCGACCTTHLLTHLHERVLLCPASMVSSCLIYKLGKFTGQRFQANLSPYSLWKFTEFRAETLPCLWNSKLCYPPPPPMPLEFQSKKPPLSLGIPRCHPLNNVLEHEKTSGKL